MKKQHEVVISQNFKTQMDNLNIMDQLQKNCTPSYKGNVTKIDDGLYLLKDTKGNDVCGILDCQSFLEALMDTDIAHLWSFDNRKKIGTAN